MTREDMIKERNELAKQLYISGMTPDKAIEYANYFMEELYGKDWYEQKPLTPLKLHLNNKN